MRIYHSEGVEVVALQGLDLLVERGELVAVVGASGSGKSTLQNILSGLDVSTAGLARVAGQDLLTLGTRERLSYRRRVVGFVRQQTARNLLPYLTAAENVQMPMVFARQPRHGRSERASDLLELLGVQECRDRRPAQMSGGQQQRVAIAVALSNRSEVLFADEPTGQLDGETGRSIMRLIRAVVDSQGVTAVIATHDRALIDVADRVDELRDGALVDTATIAPPG